MLNRSAFKLTIAVFALSVLLPSASAEGKVGFRQLSIMSPVAVQRGTKVEVNLYSNFTLDSTHSVFFDKPGIQMTFKETKPIASPRAGRGRLGKPFRFDVEVPKDQPTGIYECRVATNTAVSSVTHLMVTDYPVVSEEKKENGTLATAQAVNVPSAVVGYCDRLEDVDCFKIKGTKGQTLTFEVYAQRVTEAIHSMQASNSVYLMDAILTLYSPTGQVIAQNDNFNRGDSFIAFDVPEDGEYVIELRDARYIGNVKYIYCLEIADRPYAHAVFPMAVEQGKPREVEIVGHNLGQTTKVTFDAATTASLGWSKQSLKTSTGTTNPVSVFVSPNPQFTLTAKNNSQATAIAVPIPAGINGRFSEPQQSHYFSIVGVKDQYYKFEVESHRKGLSLDSVIEVYNDQGKKLSEADDIRFSKDARLYFKAPADGNYFVSIRDLHDRGGERFLYHLSAELAGPDFELSGEYYYSQIAPSTNMIWFAKLARLNGFDGPVEIIVENLPPGVTAEPVTMPKGMTQCGIILKAAPDAKIGASLVQVKGRAIIADSDGKERELIRTGAITCELQTQGGGQARWPINTQIVGVTAPLDLLKVTATPTELTLKPGDKAEFKVKIERNSGYADPVTLEMSFTYFKNVMGAQLPPGVSVSKASTGRLSGKVLEGTIILEATAKAIPVTRLPIAAIARVGITFSITTNYASNPVYLTIPVADATAAK